MHQRGLRRRFILSHDDMILRHDDMRAERKNSNPLNVIWAVQSQTKKFSAFSLPQITCISLAILFHQRGVRVVTNVGAGCDGRFGASRTNGAKADGEAVSS